VSAESVALAYFAAISRQDLDGLAACWAPDGRDVISGQLDATGPAEVRAYFEELFAAFGDLRFEVLDHVAAGERCAVRWRAAGTFGGPGSFQGLAPTGARIQLEGIDLLQVRDELIVRNDAYVDGMEVARQLGVLPAAGSPPERAMFGAFNARTAALRRAAGTAAEPVAEGVWRVRGGLPQRTFNVYLVRDGDGVLAFDAGCRQMAPAIALAAAQLGGLTRVVLGHAHTDHRGSAPLLGVPVLCHPDAVAEAQGDGGVHYQHFEGIKPPGRWLMARLLRLWDGGPVTISETVGDEVAGFRVVEVPGHAPGQIALFRESDRLALTTDAFYVLDIGTGRPVDEPQLPYDGANLDTEQARASLRRLAELDPVAAWPGHAGPVRGDVRERLLRAAG
jgi:glyoxylase-like metal-dependent hydrolase (beta-lactamase superfamily II)/predicted ester cyclase